VVTDDSHRQSVGPFFVAAERLASFAWTYRATLDAVLVGGDVVIVSPATGTVIVVHHNGLIATLGGRTQMCPVPSEPERDQVNTR
jgi:hypothetical protein